MILDIIDENSFKESDNEIVFYDKQTNFNFAKLIYNNHSFKIGWNSDLVEPIILKIESNIFAIGIDQNFAIIDFKNKNVLLKLKLFYSFYDVKIYKNGLYVCTELDVLVLSNLNYTILKRIALPEFYEEISFNDNTVIVNCIGGLIIKSIIITQI